MKVVRGEARHRPVGSLAVVLAAMTVLAVAVARGSSLAATAPIIFAVVVGGIFYRTLLSWRWLLGLIVGVILFIPIRRYSLPASLPFNLEPYRVLVAFVAAAWGTSLLIDPRVRLRRTGIDGPVILYIFIIYVSLLANTQRVGTVSGEVYKKLAFFASFFIILYLVSSVVRRARDIEFIVKALAGGGAILAVFALLERRTGYNAFNHLSTIIPFLHLVPGSVPDTGTIATLGRLRVFASAQHAIALGAAFAMLLPLAAYRAHAHRLWYWWVAAALNAMGALASGSRTAVIMLVVEAVVFVWLRPREMARLWPLLVPGLLFVHIATPGALGTVRAFFPKGGLVNQQQDAAVGSGRLATLGPALHTEFKNPLVGEGFGTRVTKPTDLVPVKNGPILDDEWLGVLLETGILGAVTLLWMFLRFIRQASREARLDRTPRGWLLTSITASVAGFAAGMFFYDAFSFIQVTFLLFIFLGLGVATRYCPSAEWATQAVPLRTGPEPEQLQPVPAP